MARDESFSRIHAPEICRSVHSERPEHTFLHERFTAHSTNLFDTTLEIVEPFSRVAEFRTRLECGNQGLVGVLAPVRKAARMAQNVSRRDPSSPFSDGSILAHIGSERPIQIQLVFVGKLEHRVCEDLLPHRGGGKDRIRCNGRFAYRVRKASIVLPDESVAIDYAHAKSWQARQLHQSGQRIHELLGWWDDHRGSRLVAAWSNFPLVRRKRIHSRPVLGLRFYRRNRMDK